MFPDGRQHPKRGGFPRLAAPLRSQSVRLCYKIRHFVSSGLDATVADARALLAQLRQLSADLAPARHAAAAAESLARTARKAYAQHNFDQRSLTDYETTALERAVQVTTILRQIDEDRIMLAVELGLDLPHMRIALTAPPQ